MKQKQNNFLTVQCTQTAKFCEVVRIYDTYLRSVMDNLLDFFRDEVRGKMPEINEAEHLVFDSHMHHLYFKKKDKKRKAIVQKIAKDLLKQAFNGVATFEDLHTEVANKIRHLPEVGPVVIYDVTKFIGYALHNRITPKDYVYLHGKVMKGAKFLNAHSEFDINKACKINGCDYINKVEFPPCFQKLDASHIEDILCIIGHFCEDYDGNLKLELSRPSSMIDLYIYNILRGIAGHDGNGKCKCQCLPCTKTGKCSTKEDGIQIWNCPCHATNCKSCKLKESLNRDCYEKFY